LSRTRVTEIELPRRPLRQRPLLGARRRETPGPHRGGLGESWRPRELGSRFHSSRRPSPRGTTEGRILIVDDESAIRLICRLNLRSAGFDTLEAADGASALALARAERPDLILLDIMLPEVDGWSVADELSAKDETRDIPVLFLSARSDNSDQVRGHEKGGVGYITKPFDPLAMTETVRKVLERARAGERDALRREWRRSIGG
jgi:CheY-like chemotaxis protein